MWGALGGVPLRCDELPMDTLAVADDPQHVAQATIVRWSNKSASASTGASPSAPPVCVNVATSAPPADTAKPGQALTIAL